MEVPEADVRDVSVGQTGQILLASLPETPVSFKVTTIVPTTEAKEGINFYRVEAVLQNVDNRIRPGMEGIAKIGTGEARLIWIWTRKLIDWARLTWWRWAP